MKKFSCLMLMMLLMVVSAFAQNQIKGTVVDEDGLGIIGATVVVQGATNGAVTDLDGRFSLNASEGQTIEISYVSYETIIQKVTKQSDYHFVMKSSSEILEEVVVVGYSTQKRNTITAAVATVSSDAIVSRPVTDVTSALQGNVAGFNFNTAATGGATGGELGTPIAFNIRGNGSINGGNPYVLIDGVEQSMQNVNPADIASVTVLKDASASAVYGARAAYGVVLITTKSGKKGKAIVSYNGTVGASSPIGLPDPMNSLEYATYVNQRNANTDGPVIYNSTMIDKIKGFMANPYSAEFPGIEAAEQGNWWGTQNAYANTNWYDFYYKKFSLQHSHNLNVSGGSENSTYYVGMGYVFQDGSMNFVKDNYDKFNLNARLEIRANDWLKFNINNNLTFARTRRPIQNQLILYTNVARASPLMPEKYPIDSKYNVTGDIPNLMASQYATNQLSDALTLSATVTPIEGWSITGDVKARFDIADNSYTLNKSKSILPDGTVTENTNSLQGYSYPGMWWRSVKPGSFTRGSAYDYYISPNVISTYENSWGNHYFKALAGYQMELKYMSSMYAYKDGMLSDDIYSMANANGSVIIGEARTHWATMGVMSRLNYNYNDTYFVEVSGRYDGSSRFASSNRWGLFPSISVGYDIARENYFKDASLPISQLKIRASYGRLGNQNGAGLHDYLSTMPLTSTGSWIFSGTSPDMYASVPKMISPYITWEKVDNANLGIDITALDNRLTVTADIYERTTRDMLGPAEAIPSIGGISAGSVSKVNNASLRNRGWELSVNWQDKLDNGFRYGVGFNVFDYKAVVTEYNNPTGIIRNLHQTGAVDANHGYYVGMDVGEIWGYQADQLFQSNAEINQYVKEVDLTYFGTNDSWQCGDLKYIDYDGDGKVSPGDGTLENRGDLKIIGNATPRYSFGFNLNAGYKGFEVTALLQGVAKRDFIASGSTYLFGGGNYFKEHLDYWSPTNPDAYLPRLTKFKSIEDQRNTGYNTSRYLLNAAYMRLKNLMVSYSFNDNVLKSLHLGKLRVYVSCDNLFTIDGLPDVFDPETINQINWMAGGSGAAAPGLTSALMQNGNGMVYPLNRKYVLGLDISF